MSKNLSFTLNFGEEDEPLWGFLHSYPPEQWEGILKEALRAYSANPPVTDELPPATVGHWSLEELYAAPSAQDALITDNPQPLKHLLALIGEEEDEEVLELLLQQQARNPERFPEKDALPPKADEEPVAAQDDVSGDKGLAFLLHQVIGEEEDPDVLSFFASSENRKET
ncbi:hypothetical protein [Desulfitobacterium chlororespirans]|uniref:Uncharacterized protein n=1 Tax=Desulfitobacterium chlororespirans DSM 11544 TaxID=1121395 RepID=A0A1M7UPQ5_9FIRM|nr:hypothetical protein [Desulfitobacterium chlororespirans]SHN84949.1 hypothetical protein SAMN02745215_04320 [Desulfitobacterium chlororespirans DSM 11544]